MGESLQEKCEIVYYALHSNKYPLVTSNSTLEAAGGYPLLSVTGIPKPTATDLRLVQMSTRPFPLEIGDCSITPQP